MFLFVLELRYTVTTMVSASRGGPERHRGQESRGPVRCARCVPSQGRSSPTAPGQRAY